MSSKHYTDEFKIEAVKQVTVRGHAVADVAERLGISQHSLYQWLKQFGVPEAQRTERRSQQEEIRLRRYLVRYVVRGCQNTETLPQPREHIATP